MLLTVLAELNSVWVEDNAVEIANTDNLLVEVIKELKRLRKDKCDKYIVHDHIGEKYIIVDFDGEESNHKIVTGNELEGLIFLKDF